MHTIAIHLVRLNLFIGLLLLLGGQVWVASRCAVDINPETTLAVRLRSRDQSSPHVLPFESGPRGTMELGH